MISNVLLFLNSLSFIDYVFFFTVVFLIVLIVSLVYFIKTNEQIMASDEETSDSDNLSSIVSKIQKEAKPITFTSYEKEQEDKAINSYDELKSNSGDKAVFLSKIASNYIEYYWNIFEHLNYPQSPNYNREPLIYNYVKK